MTDDVDSSVGGSAPTRRPHPGPPKGKPVYAGQADVGAIVDEIERARHPEDVDVLRESHGRDVSAKLKHQLPPLRLPGFGEPEDDCGDFILPAMRFCVKCGRTHEFKHNCLRYDCPLHAPYAVRRRAAGADADEGMVGIAPKLKSLLLRLYKARGEENHHYHHLFISPPDDFYFESENPLERGKEVVREIMDQLGIQGFVGYHPKKGEDEDRHGDDRGFWQKILFHRRDWSDVYPKLKEAPHFHVIGVAPYVDVRGDPDVDDESVTEQIEERTGWVVHRREDDDTKKSIAGDPNDPNDTDDHAMARALTYALSHCGIYETESGQKRLAAWVKGPDVHTTQVYNNVAKTVQATVYEAAETVLGLSVPALECDHDATVREQVEVENDVDPGSVTIADVDAGPSGPAGPSGAWGSGHVSGVGGRRSDGLDLGPPPTGWDAFGEPAGASASSSTGTASAADDVDTDVPECGGYLRHISKAGQYLLDPDWRDVATFDRDLDRVYRDYIAYMTSRDLDPLDAIPTLPEADEPDEPPPPD